MSATFILPVKFECDMPGCHVTAMVMCACDEREGSREISPESNEPKLPEGWTQNYWGGHWCKSCSEKPK